MSSVNWRKWVPLAVLLVGLVVFLLLDGGESLSSEKLSRNYRDWQSKTERYGIWAVLLYMGIYVGITAFAIPFGATVLSLTGGLLFGAFWGTLWIVIAATLGATITFLAVKMALGAVWQERTSYIEQLRLGFQANGFSYLLFLRLVPIFPFFMINIAAGILNLPLKTFVLGTFLGIIPGTFVFAWTGSGLGFLLSQGQAIETGVVLTPEILGPILALAALTLTPIVYRKYQRQRKTKGKLL